MQGECREVSAGGCREVSAGRECREVSAGGMQGGECRGMQGGECRGGMASLWDSLGEGVEGRPDGRPDEEVRNTLTEN